MATSEPTPSPGAPSALTRRKAMALLGLSPWAAAQPGVAAAANTTTPRVLTSWCDERGRAFAGVWTPGGTRWATALPARAHQLLLLPPPSPSQEPQVLVVARRPGEYLARLNLRTGRLLQLHAMEPDRYLSGHAVLSQDGRCVYTTESDGETGQGVIAQRDVRSLETVREFPSAGIGPHALLWDAHGNLLIANGGILTLPETGRRKRNLSQMAPNLVRMDTGSAAVLGQYALPDPFLSLRHLALAPDGTVAVALQAEHADSAARQASPALALWGPDGLNPVAWPQDTGAPPGWQGYAGDVCWSGQAFHVSATGAGQVLAWSASGEWRGMTTLAHATALAHGPGGLVAGGRHQAIEVAAREPHNTGTPTGRPERRYPLAVGWDNHGLLL